MKKRSCSASTRAPRRSPRAPGGGTIASLAAAGLLAPLLAPTLAWAEPPPAGRAFPTLAQAVELAKENAPRMISARSEVAIGRSGYAAARMSPLTNPYLEVFADRGSFGTKDVAVTGNLWFPVELSGQRGRRVAEVDSLVAWKSASADAVRADVAGRTVAAYGSVVVAAERVRTFEAILATSKDEAAFFRARMAAGDATLRDAALADVEVARNNVTVGESKADLARALAELEQLTALEEIAPPDRDLPDPPRLPADALASAERIAIRSPAVAASEREADYFLKAKERQAIEAHAPVNLIVSAGRGDLGETRLGGGLSWTFPILRKNQGEQARADAERGRALAERGARIRVVTSVIRGLAREHAAVRTAIDEMVQQGEPAAQISVDSAIIVQRAGKADLLSVLIARRDLVMLKARRLELVRRDWQLAGELVSVSGELSR